MKQPIAIILFVAAVLAIAGAAAARAGARPAGARAWLDPRASTAAAAEPVWVLVGLTEKADLSGAARLSTKAERGSFVMARLREVADRTQPPLVRWLEGRGATVERFWIDNLLRARVDSATLARLAARPEVATIRLEGRVHLIDPVPPGPEDLDLARQAIRSAAGMRPLVVEGGIKEINADEVWKMGYKGAGIVVAVTDTGADLRHPALKKNYRGYPEMTHDYNWLDAVKEDQEPLDAGGHGTHVTGIVIGSDPVRQVGVAPAAKFISCRLIEERSGPDSASLRCLQWILAPTKLDDTEPRPDLAPDVVNASWGNEPGDACLVDTLRGSVRALEAAGILFVASAGNSGDKCQTVCVPGAYPETFTVGNYDVRAKEIHASSSRGPAAWSDGDLVKPDISAPGTNINSSVPPSRYEQLTGTSMASPHIAGAAALLLSARPELRGRPQVVRAILEATARKGRNTARCGGDDGASTKDNIEGVGVVDVKQAVVLALTATPPPPPTETPTATSRPSRTPTPLATETPTASETPDVGAAATPPDSSPPHRVFAPYVTRRWAIIPENPVLAR